MHWSPSEIGKAKICTEQITGQGLDGHLNNAQKSRPVRICKPWLAMTLILMLFGQAVGNESIGGAGMEMALSDTYRHGGKLWGTNGSEICRGVSVTKETAKAFQDSLLTMRANFAIIHIRPENESHISLTRTDDVLFETVWVWTLQGRGGAFPYVWYARDVYSVSGGHFDWYTVRDITLTLTSTSPTPCVLRIGESKSTQIIANAYNTMLEPMYSVKPEYKRSMFCYSVKLERYGAFLYYITHLLGIEKGYIGYKCCEQRQDIANISRTISKCSSKIETVDWYYFIVYIMILVGFIYSPIAVTFTFYHVLGDSDNTAQERSSKNIKMEENLMASNSNTGEKWIYPGVDKPITVCKFFVSFCRCFNSCPRLQRLVVVLLSFLVVVVMVATDNYDGHNDHEILGKLENGIPVGFFGLAYKFSWNLGTSCWNMFGGPFTMYGAYIILGTAILCVPKDFSRLLESVLKENSKTDLETIKTWRGVDLYKLGGYHFIYEVLTSNMYLFFNCKFCCKRLKNTNDKFYEERTRESERNKCPLDVSSETTPLKRDSDRSETKRRKCDCCSCLKVTFICVIRKLFEIMYYCLPPVFITVTIIRGYYKLLREKYSNWFKAFALSSAIALITVYNLIAFAILFMCSGIYILSFVEFFLISLIIYPNFTTSYVCAWVAAINCVMKQFIEFNETYAELFEMTVKASINEEDKRNKAIQIIDSTIVISPDYPSSIKSIKVGQKDISLPEIENLTQNINPENNGKQLVNWVDCRPGIPLELFEQVRHECCPLDKRVFFFFFRIAAFVLLILFIWQMSYSFNIEDNLNTLTVVITGIALTLLPLVTNLFVSDLNTRHRRLDLERRIKQAVKNYVSVPSASAAVQQDSDRQALSICPRFCSSCLPNCCTYQEQRTANFAVEEVIRSPSQKNSRGTLKYDV